MASGDTPRRTEPTIRTHTQRQRNKKNQHVVTYKPKYTHIPAALIFFTTTSTAKGPFLARNLIEKAGFTSNSIFSFLLREFESKENKVTQQTIKQTNKQHTHHLSNKESL